MREEGLRIYLKKKEFKERKTSGKEAWGETRKPSSSFLRGIQGAQEDPTEEKEKKVEGGASR